MPESPFIGTLNARAKVCANDGMGAVAGDVEGSGIVKRLKVLGADAFFLGDHDMVVNTRAMVGGVPASSRRVATFRGSAYSHSNYFTDEATRTASLRWLTDADGDGKPETRVHRPPGAQAPLVGLAARRPDHQARGDRADRARPAGQHDRDRRRPGLAGPSGDLAARGRGVPRQRPVEAERARRPLRPAGGRARAGLREGRPVPVRRSRDARGHGPAAAGADHQPARRPRRAGPAARGHPRRRRADPAGGPAPAARRGRPAGAPGAALAAALRIRAGRRPRGRP